MSNLFKKILSKATTREEALILAKALALMDEEEQTVTTSIIPMLEEQNPLDNAGIIIINGEISKESLAAATKRLFVLHFDPHFNDPVQIIINSGGGYCDAGWAFIDTMGFIKNPVHTLAVGEICSMAVMLFVAGDHRTMSPNSSAMIHQHSDFTMGNYAEMVAKRPGADAEHMRGINHFIQHSKYKTKADIEKHVQHAQDHWLTPQEMKKHGLCDVITQNRKKAARKKK